MSVRMTNPLYTRLVFRCGLEQRWGECELILLYIRLMFNEICVKEQRRQSKRLNGSQLKFLDGT
jgi:hypothetical protein